MTRRFPHHRLIAVYDRMYRLYHRLDRAESDVPPSFRVDVRRSRRGLVLSDGAEIRRGDHIGVLHTNNEQVAQLHVRPLTPIALGLEVRRQLFASLQTLAILSQPGGRFRDVVAYTAVTIFHHGLARAGFEVEKDGVAFAALVGAYQRALLASLHPAGRSRLIRLAAVRSERLWISRDKLLALYLHTERRLGQGGPPCAGRFGRPVMDFRRRAALELAGLAVAVPLFLILVPVRPMLVDLGLAAIGLAFIAHGWHETRRRVWSDGAGRTGGCRADRVLASATLAASLAMVAAGVFLGRATDAMSAAAFLATVALFAPWAWVQQVIFQFYLLGRLRLLLRGVGDVVVAGTNGVLFAAVHAPQWDLVLITGPAAWLWSYCYLRSRRLVPLALSHAALATAYFSSLRGEDLLRRWLAFLW